MVDGEKKPDLWLLFLEVHVSHLLELAQQKMSTKSLLLVKRVTLSKLCSWQNTKTTLAPSYNFKSVTKSMNTFQVNDATFES